MSWTILFGLVCRCALSTLREPASDETHSTAHRMQVYVDDPVLVLRGPRAFRRRQVAMRMLAWRIIGVSLAIKKGQLGKPVDWVGITVSPHDGGPPDGPGVLATIQAARMKEIEELADHL